MQEYSKKDTTEFVNEFGKSWKDIKDKYFLWILSCTLSLSLVLILIIANRDYAILQKNLSEQITKKYLQTLFSKIKIITFIEPIDSTSFYSNINTNVTSPIETDGKIKPEIGGSSNGTIVGESDGLNLADVNLPEALVAIKNISGVESFVRPIQHGKTKTIEIDDVKPFDPWETPIQRLGEIQIEPVEEIVRGSQFVRGWRNPDEITFAIQKQEPMIEHCYKREAKFFSDLRGYVIVRFIILHTGRVDPNSVKIIKSNLYNKKVEMCIKKRLKSWRGFDKLDASNGSVAVVQKFIFN
jgi:hypothetical protein